MDPVRATLGGNVHLADAAAVFRLELPAFDFEFLERVKRGQQQVGVEVGIGIFNAIQSVVVVGKPLASDVQGEIIWVWLLLDDG